MSPKLRDFLTENCSQLPGEPTQKLLLYIAFVQCFCYQKQISCDRFHQLEGLLPRLFHEISDHEVEKSAVIFDAAMPWGLLQSDPLLSNKLNEFRQLLTQSACATPKWLQEQVNDLFEFDKAFPGVVITPPSVCSLIAQLAAQQPAQQIIDLCCGTFSLGLQVWKELGSAPFISCHGEEINSYLCAFSRLLLFLCGVKDFTVKERNVMDLPAAPQGQNTPHRIYVADFPLAGNRTLPLSPYNPHFEGPQMTLYADWVLILSVLNRMQTGDRAFLIVTKGALVRKNERALREHIVQHNWLDAVIQLPAGLYPSHNLPLNLLILDKGREDKKRDHVFFADLSDFSTPNTRRMKALSQDGIAKLCQALRHFTVEEGFSKTVSIQHIQSAAYSFYPPAHIFSPQAFANQIRLGDIATVTRGLQLPKGQFSVQTEPRYLLNIRDLQDGEICYENAEQIEGGSSLWEAKYRIQEDDIILTSKGAALKIAIVPPDPPASYISGNLTLLRTNSNLYSPYVLYEYLTSEAGRSALSLIQTGTTIRVLGSSNLEQLKIPDYDQALAAKTGLALKLATLQYRKDLLRITQTYTNQKTDLLSELNQGRESHT